MESGIETPDLFEPANKKLLIEKVGRALIARHGSQSSYSPAQVRQATFTAGYAIEDLSWAMTVFTTQSDFTAFHQTVGVPCDYAAMKAQMLDLDANFDLA